MTDLHPVQLITVYRCRYEQYRPRLFAMDDMDWKIEFGV